MISSGPPPALARSSKLPSGPSGGPVTSSTSSPNWRIKSSQQSTVFSCAPPMMSRVMMWTIRMGEGTGGRGQGSADKDWD